MLMIYILFCYVVCPFLLLWLNSKQKQTWRANMIWFIMAPITAPWLGFWFVFTGSQ